MNSTEQIANVKNTQQLMPIFFFSWFHIFSQHFPFLFLKGNQVTLHTSWKLGLLSL